MFFGGEVFLNKIKDMANTWNVPYENLHNLAKESLLYGMKLNSSPNQLKKEMRKQQVDSKLATELFKGTSYLLHDIPKVLIKKKEKIINLNDFLFAKSVLDGDQIELLKQRVQKLDQIDIHALYDTNLQNVINNHTKRGSFFSKYDSMYEKSMDFKQTLAAEAIQILNLEIDKLTAFDSDTVGKYVNKCLGNKAKTKIRKLVPKSFKITKEVREEIIEDLKVYTANGVKTIRGEVRTVEESRNDSLFQSFESEVVAENVSYGSDTSQLMEVFEDSFENVDFRYDMKKILPEKVFDGIALYCGFAPETIDAKYKQYIINEGFDIRTMTEAVRKKTIEKFVGIAVFKNIKENKQLKEYLQVA